MQSLTFLPWFQLKPAARRHSRNFTTDRAEPASQTATQPADLSILSEQGGGHCTEARYERKAARLMRRQKRFKGTSAQWVVVPTTVMREERCVALRPCSSLPADSVRCSSLCGHEPEVSFTSTLLNPTPSLRSGITYLHSTCFFD